MQKVVEECCGKDWNKTSELELTPEVHDSGNICEGDEDADEDEDGRFEVGQEEDGGKVDGDDG